MANEQAERVARCACGNLTVTARGEPPYVHLCSCTDCQRGSGSAFSYSAFFPEIAVSVAGEKRTYRQLADSGRYIESFFCPTCGTTVMFRAEGLPGTVGVAVGCFADANFAKPSKLYWASRRHHWLELPEDITLIDTQ